MNEIDLIREINDRLINVQAEVNNEISDCYMPSTYIVGCPRSGTTALLQYLSSTGAWSYPTNLLTRFSSSVYIGSLVQEVLFNSNFGLIKDYDSFDFKSSYGRSLGPLNANEFFHFFRRFFPKGDIGHLTQKELSEVNVSDLLKEIETIAKTTNKPFLCKGLMFQYNLNYFQRVMPNNIFLYIKRNERFVMQSIYKARIKETGNIATWWSAKPKEYEFLTNKSIEEQVAGQVFYTNKAIESNLELIPIKNKLIINYEDFIAAPEDLYAELVNKYRELGFPIERLNFSFPKNIVDGNKDHIDKDTLNKMVNHYNEMNLSTNG